MVLKEAKPDDLMIDDMCAGSLDEAFWSGAHSGIGGPLSLAPGWLLPRFQKQGSGRLPRLHQPRAAATKRSPRGTRLPYPEILIKAVVLASAWKLKLGDKALEVGVILVLVHHCCLHPGEPIQITREDLSPDSSARIHLVVIIRPPRRLHRP